MAPIKVICAGYGRSGTVSLRLALNTLGYKCHHTKDLMESPNCSSESLAFHQAYLDRDSIDLDKLYEGYDATADFISAAFYKDMLAEYPDAKVILTERPVDIWFKSVKNTIFQAVLTATKRDPNDPFYEFNELGATIAFNGLLRDCDNLKNEELFKKMYLDHNEEVKRLVPAKRLYIMQTGEGWEGICKFLGKDVPDMPYPYLNSSKSFSQEFELIL